MYSILFGHLVVCRSQPRAISKTILSISKGYFYHINRTTEALTQGIDAYDVAVCLGRQITKNCSPNSKIVKVFLQRGHQATSLLTSFPGPLKNSKTGPGMSLRLEESYIALFPGSSSASYRAAGSNLQMVRPSLMSMVKLLIICAQSTRQNIGPSYFEQSGGALIALQLQTGSYHSDYFAVFYRTTTD